MFTRRGGEEQPPADGQGVVGQGEGVVQGLPGLQKEGQIQGRQARHGPGQERQGFMGGEQHPHPGKPPGQKAADGLLLAGQGPVQLPGTHLGQVAAALGRPVAEPQAGQGQGGAVLPPRQGDLPLLGRGVAQDQHGPAAARPFGELQGQQLRRTTGGDDPRGPVARLHQGAQERQGPGVVGRQGAAPGHDAAPLHPAAHGLKLLPGQPVEDHPAHAVIPLPPLQGRRQRVAVGQQQRLPGPLQQRQERRQVFPGQGGAVRREHGLVGVDGSGDLAEQPVRSGHLPGRGEAAAHLAAVQLAGMDVDGPRQGARGQERLCEQGKGGLLLLLVGQGREPRLQLLEARQIAEQAPFLEITGLGMAGCHGTIDAAEV